MKKLTIATLALFAFSVAAQTLPEPVKQFEKQGIEIIKPFKAPGGVNGWLGKYQGTGVTIYLTPDGKHAISGYMYDEQGHNLSEQVINDEIYIPAGREMWQRLTAAPGIVQGSAGARCKVVVFADTFCPYCKKFSQQVKPAIEANVIQLKTQLVGILQPESGVQASAILAASDPAEAWSAFERSNGKTLPPSPSATPKEVVYQIQHNQRLMDELGANGTPAIYYLNQDRKLQQIVGMPDAKQLADLLACQ